MERNSIDYLDGFWLRYVALIVRQDLENQSRDEKLWFESGIREIQTMISHAAS